MKLSIRNRIALYFMTATAVMAALSFMIVYTVVHNTVYNRLDDDLNSQYDDLEKSIFIDGSRLIFTNEFEWAENGRAQVGINPFYVEIDDPHGNIIRKSRNLYEHTLYFDPAFSKNEYFNTNIAGTQVRELHIPLKDSANNMIAYILVAIPLEDSIMVLDNLKLVLLWAFPFVLVVLFFTTRVIAGRSIIPVNRVISTASKITKENISERIELPPKKDELHVLTSTINGLLDRLEDAVLREKQFTADASHELRTPLSIMKGTLQVLIRRQRDVKDYETKIKYCINEVDRMSGLIDHLLLLARYESGAIEPETRQVDLNESIAYVLYRMNDIITHKGMEIRFANDGNHFVNADPSMLEVIIENIISNALKYSNGNKLVDICIDDSAGKTTCVIKDYGIGISQKHLDKIFDRFYRGEQARNVRVSGHGLGLAIVKKLADLQNLCITYESELSKGTTVKIAFPEEKAGKNFS